VTEASKPFLRILHCRILPWVAMLMLTAVAWVSFAPKAAAQEERPQITPGERKAQHKKDAGPRAVGVIQLGTKGKASFIPIAILINGKFWDASAYKADPVPMALDSGNVYEGERSGNSLGLFTIGSALHSNNPNAAIPWLGTGVWRPTGTEPVVEAKKAESAPVGIGSDDAPPRLTRDTSTAKATPPASSPAPASTSSPTSAAGGTSSSAPATSSTTKPASSSGDEPPRLTKGSSAPPAETASAQPAPSVSSAPSSSKPTDAKPGDTKAGDKTGDQAKDNRVSLPASDSGAAEANRPRLRRGKPVESFADEEIPGYSRPGVKPVSAANSGKVVEAAAANNADVQLIPAISDAAGPEPRSFAFEWIPGEEQDRRKQMIDLAIAQLRAYIDAKSKNTVEAKPTHPSTGKHAEAAKPAEPDLEKMQMVAYDLWNSNQPVLILSAQAHMPQAAGSASSEADANLQYSILVVAYPDIYHNLKKLYVGITDKFHFDVTPRLELIDAVDADGDGYGELLFRETTDQGTGWVIYRATADKLWKMFDSLNPE